MDTSMMAYDWFKNLIDDEIKQELGTIDNENAWADGSPDTETAEMHRENVKAHEFYISILKDAYREIIGEDYDSGKANAY